MGEYLQIKDKGMVKNYLGNPEAEMKGDLTKDLTSISSMIEENNVKLKGKLKSVTDLVNKKIDTGKLNKAQAEGLVGEYDGKLKTAVLEVRDKGEKDVELLMKKIDGIMASSNLKANPEYVIANKNSNPDTNSLLSFVKGNTKIGKTVGDRASL